MTTTCKTAYRMAILLWMHANTTQLLSLPWHLSTVAPPVRRTMRQSPTVHWTLIHNTVNSTVASLTMGYASWNFCAISKKIPVSQGHNNLILYCSMVLLFWAGQSQEG